MIFLVLHPFSKEREKVKNKTKNKKFDWLHLKTYNVWSITN